MKPFIALIFLIAGAVTMLTAIIRQTGEKTALIIAFAVYCLIVGVGVFAADSVIPQTIEGLGFKVTAVTKAINLEGDKQIQEIRAESKKQQDLISQLIKDASSAKLELENQKHSAERLVTSLKALRAETAPRILTAENAKRLTRRLLLRKGLRVSVGMAVDEGEVQRYARQIRKAMTDGGWDVRPFTTFEGASVTGIGIFVPDEHNPPQEILYLKCCRL
jgi:hypothetical protein